MFKIKLYNLSTSKFYTKNSNSLLNITIAQLLRVVHLAVELRIGRKIPLPGWSLLFDQSPFVEGIQERQRRTVSRHRKLSSGLARTIPTLIELNYQELWVLDSGLFQSHPSWSDRLLPTPRGCLAVDNLYLPSPHIYTPLPLNLTYYHPQK